MFYCSLGCTVFLVVAYLIPCISSFHLGGVTVTTKPPHRLISCARRAIAIPLDNTEPSTKATGESNNADQNKPKLPRLAPEDAWIAKLDYDGFEKEVRALGKSFVRSCGEKDVRHLNKIVNWRNICAMIGISTVWTTPNPVTILALSTWTYASWTMIAHHTCHGGYNRVDAGRYHSRGFALGLLNRCVDWLDWMMPEAWNIEHNRLHHYRLNELKDPDLVQRNLEFLRDSPIPQSLKYVAVMVFLPIWKWYYYAPNTYKELQINEWMQKGKPLPKGFDPEQAATIATLMDPRQSALRQIVKPIDVFFKVLGPMLFGRYVVIPSLLLVLVVPFGGVGMGMTLANHALVNLFLAELLTNIHAFVTIVTNHAGEDMYTFDTAVKPKTGSFYVRQIVGSVNYHAGNDLVDFGHGWLNYQIEHHVWPDLSMRQYQQAAPQLKALCAKYGVPYIQESVFTRLRKTIDIMVGKTTARQFPTEYEPLKDKSKDVVWKSNHGPIDA